MSGAFCNSLVCNMFIISQWQLHVNVGTTDLTGVILYINSSDVFTAISNYVYIYIKRDFFYFCSLLFRNEWNPSLETSSCLFTWNVNETRKIPSVYLKDKFGDILYKYFFSSPLPSLYLTLYFKNTSGDVFLFIFLSQQILR